MSSQVESHRVTVKETVTSIVIAFVMAFVARGFVVEAFLIPTGSMAPTLMGAHMEITSPNTGYTWPVGPHYYDRAHEVPLPIQGTHGKAVLVNDPMSQEPLTGPRGEGLVGLPRLAGDRIFVLKYLYSIFDPQRFDVVVFKNPCNPSVNFIKRLIGLPNEQIALVDGDVFFRKTPGVAAKPSDLTQPVSSIDTWYGDGWQIARKPERVQRSVWQPVFDSEYTPLDEMSGKATGFRCPWKGEGGGWNELSRSTSYTHKGGVGVLAWDSTAREINDNYPYNQSREFDARKAGKLFPVSDVRVSFGIEPKAGETGVGATLQTRGHEFRAKMDQAGAIVLEMRPAPNGGSQPEWKKLAQEEIDPLPAGKVTNLEFWFVDQTIQLWIEGRRVAYAEYGWNIQDRVRMTLRPLEELLKGNPQDTYEVFKNAAMYPKPEVRIDFESEGGVTLYRVALDRDLFYQPDVYPQWNEPREPHSKRDQPAQATHPMQTPSLGPDEFFVCGDNSPASSDARLWDAPDPWVATKIDETMGVVARQLLIGRAFFVYFPSLHTNHNVPVPDFGRMRWIW
jgi:signal peptidase I